MTNDSLMKVESIAECSPSCNTFDLKPIFGRFLHTKYCIFILYQLEGWKSKNKIYFYNCILPSKNVKEIYPTMSDLISLIGLPAHYLSVPNAILILAVVNRQIEVQHCFSYKSLFPTLTL